MFKVHITRFKNGEVMPILCRLPGSTPVLVPFIYTVVRRRHRAVNTLKNDALVYKWLYQWVWENLNQDLDELIISRKIGLLIENLEQFGFWLRTGRVANNLIGRVGRDDAKTDWLLPPTFDAYMKSVERLLLWSVERFPPTERQDIRQRIYNLKASIKAKFEALYLGLHGAVEVNGLDEVHLEAVLITLHPNSLSNPFRQNARLRNWLIYRLFLETGIRRGELLKLKTTDIYENENRFYVAIRREPDDPMEIRIKAPAQKTLPRLVSISRPLFLDLENYIKSFRRPKRDHKSIPLKHSYLFTSERGFPLSISALNYSFEVMNKFMMFNFGVRLHPHTLRNTFCNNYLEWRVDSTQVELERALDELRQLCGWTLDSKMPMRYASKWFAKQANYHNSKRIEASFGGESQ